MPSGTPSVGQIESADDLETQLSVALLELVTLALGTVSVGRDPRGLLCRRVAPLFDALAAAHVLIDLPTQKAELFLWRQTSAAIGATAQLRVQEPGLTEAPEATQWFASAARRAMHQWIDLPYLAELPLTVSLGRLCFFSLGRMSPFDGDDERLLSLTGRHVGAIEAVRWRLTSAELNGRGEVPGTESVAGSCADAGPSASIHLTHREVEVLLLLREGLLARSIAGRLGLSERTVHKHLASVYTKLGVHDRLLAVRRAESLGFATLAGLDPENL